MLFGIRPESALTITDELFDAGPDIPEACMDVVIAADVAQHARRACVVLRINPYGQMG